LIGAIGGALVVFAVPFFDKLKIDDPVGALSVHLVNGIWGTLAVGIFASNGKDITLLGQIKGIAVVGVLAFVLSYVAIYAIDKLYRFRADDDDQLEGLDMSECGLESYPEFVRS
jgi:Amt family ammonium transporter